MTVGNSSVAVNGFPNLVTSLEVGLYRGYGDVILISGELWGLITQGALERGHTSGGTGHQIMGTFNPRKACAPGARV